VDAVGDPDAVVRGTCDGQARMLRQRRLDARESLGVAEDVLRHPMPPAMDPRKNRIGIDSKEPDLRASHRDEL
jgi:hypothetical protein